MKINKLIENIEVIDTSKSKCGRGVMSVSVVNSENGKRVTLSGALLAALGNPDNVQFAADSKENILYIAEDLGGTQKHQNIKHGKKGIIYNAALVQKITDSFNIDYSDKTSVTFNNVTIDTDDDTGMKIAIVDMSCEKKG